MSTALTGITNIGMTVAIQAAGGTAWLGAWAAASAPMMIALAVQRAVLSQTVLRGAGVRQVPRCLVVLTLAGAAAVLATALVVFFLKLPPPLFILLVGVPLSLLQDLYRMRQFGQQRPALSLASDALWAFVSVLVVLVGFYSGAAFSAERVVSAYVIGALVAVIFAGLTWPAESKDLGRLPTPPVLLLETGATQCLSALGQLAIGAALSLATLGEFKLAMTIAQPVVFVGNFLTAFLLPRLAIRQVLASLCPAGRVGALCLVVGACSVTVVSVYGSLLGGSLEVEDGVTVALSAVFLVAGLSLSSALSIVMITIRATWPPKNWLPARLIGATLDPVVAIPAALAWGSMGLAVGPLANSLAVCCILGAIAHRCNSRAEGITVGNRRQSSE